MERSRSTLGPSVRDRGCGCGPLLDREQKQSSGSVGKSAGDGATGMGRDRRIWAAGAHLRRWWRRLAHLFEARTETEIRGEEAEHEEEESVYGDMTWVVAGDGVHGGVCGSGNRSSSCSRKKARKGLGDWGLEANQGIEQQKEAAALTRIG